MQKNLPAIDNFCTTLPTYITEMLQYEADKNDNSLSESLQQILEAHYGIGNWRKKLIDETLKTVKIKMNPYGSDNYKSDLDETKKILKIYYVVNLPFKAEIKLELNRARYELMFTIYTASKKYRKLFRNFYSHFRDGLLNRDMQMGEYARFATIGYKRNFTSSNIQEILNSTEFTDKIAEDGMFLRNITLMYKWV